jgi:uncharacterized protein YraI
MSHRLTRVVAALLCTVLVVGMLVVPETARADTGSNWTGAYYANPALQGTPVFTRIDPAVVFNWGPNPPGPGLGSQYWSARWVTIQYMNAGTYRFTVTADDGVRVFIDGQIILDAWRDQAPTTYYVNVQVSAGNHAIQVDYYQAMGDAQISVSWQQLLTPSSAWTAQYWNNPNLAGPPVLTRLENRIDYFWGLGSPDPVVFPDYFSARWTATLPFQAGTYRFYLAGDDGVRLYINDVLVIDQWRIQSLRAYVIDVPLSAGLHTLRIEYFEATEQATVRFNFELAVGPPPIPGPLIDQWYGEYFANQDLAGSPAFVRLDGYSGLSFTRDTFPLPAGFPRDYFSVRWTRQICNFPGRPTLFYAVVDDGIRFYIDNTLIIDQWRPQPVITVQQSVDLTAGCHLLRLEYRQEIREAILFFTWTPPHGQTPPLYIGGPVPITGVQAVVDTGALNVRSGPGIGFTRLTQVVRNTPLALSQRNADASWVRVTTPTGVNGWVSARYLRIVSGNVLSLPVFTAPPPVTPAPTGVRGRLGSALRLRSGPGTAFPQIGYLEWGSVVDIIGRSSDALWFQVRYGSATGWISAQYVIIVSGNLLSVPITG